MPVSPAPMGWLPVAPVPAVDSPDMLLPDAAVVLPYAPLSVVLGLLLSMVPAVLALVSGAIAPLDAAVEAPALELAICPVSALVRAALPEAACLSPPPAQPTASVTSPAETANFHLSI